MKDLENIIAKISAEMVELRHTIHAEPELSFQEFKTAALVQERLEAAGKFSIRSGLAKTGIVATLGADKPGPCVALRADMDALPIQECNKFSYASKREGQMHACGHDGHTVCLLGAALVLARMEDKLKGPVKFIFQPAEEAGNGAEELCKLGVLTDPPVKAVFGLHGWPGLPVGSVAVRKGPFFASCDTFEIRVHGKGAHAAWPHYGIDPIVIASQIVVAIQGIVSRRCDPLDSLVVTVGEFHAGTASNIIPGEAVLRGTIRALRPATRARAGALLKSIATQTAEGMGGRASVAIVDDVPSLSNDEQATAFLTSLMQETVGADMVVTDFPQVMGVEDFAFYVQRVPGTFWVLGLLPPGKSEMPQLHQPDFDFTDAAIPIGMKLHCMIGLEYAKRMQAA